MAEKKPEAGEGEAPPPRKKNTKLLLFIVIGILVIVLGGGGAAYLLIKKKNSASEDDTGDETAVSEKQKAKKEHPDAPPVFVKLEPFTVKLQVEQQEAYLQATPELRVVDAPVGERVKEYMPEIRHKVLLLMSGKKASELSTPQGVQTLANEMRNEINVIIDGPKIAPKGKGKVGGEVAAAPADEAGPDDSVRAVLFTSFIIQ
ncbi:MAG: flagellar basal body-associated FliL family protein [Rhodocyclaceae bacterium]|nr:flagellar basal body-associated FliL family protein [Rhodocyclaceae bacterium]